MPVMIGTSGWHYAHWRGGFYPRGLAPSGWLAHYAGLFDTVELNNAFYRLPERQRFAAWAEALPEGFVVAVKASRYLTHVKRLAEPAEPVHRLLERAEGLGAKLGPVLLQLPPTLRADPEALDRALAAFGRRVRVAVEVRHPSWESDATRAVLERHRAALCLADAGGPRPPRWRTADWGYVRFHRGRARPEPCYGRQALASWAGRLAELFGPDDDLYCYFNNDPAGCAPRDAHRFARALSGAGLVPSRVPSARQAPLTPPDHRA